MGAMQRRKGKAGELELARLLREHLGADVARNLEQTRQGGADLLGIDGTCTQAEATGQRPALFYRLDRQPWRVVIALRHVAAGFGHAPLLLRIETDVEVFAALVRESLP